MTEQEAIQLHISENIHRIEVIEDFLSTNSDANDKECRKNIDILTKTNKALEEVQQYREIGTLEECRAAVEKQKEKKPPVVNRPSIFVKVPVCPNCSTPEHYQPLYGKTKYCSNCGQKLDWSEVHE